MHDKAQMIMQKTITLPGCLLEKLPHLETKNMEEAVNDAIMNGKYDLIRFTHAWGYRIRTAR